MCATDSKQQTFLTKSFKYNDETIGQGRDKAKAYLKENPKVLAEIDKKVRDKVKESES